MESSECVVLDILYEVAYIHSSNWVISITIDIRMRNAEKEEKNSQDSHVSVARALITYEYFSHEE